MSESTATEPVVQPDTELGAFVYCRSHVRPHATGWCSVSAGEKIPLRARTSEEAYAEVRAYGWKISGEEALAARVPDLAAAEIIWLARRFEQITGGRELEGPARERAREFFELLERPLGRNTRPFAELKLEQIAQLLSAPA